MRTIARRCAPVAMALIMALPVCAMRKPGDPLKPGFNLFSKQQDVQLGQQAAQQVRQQYQVVNNQELQDYIRRVGERLAATTEARNSGFPFTFTMVNDRSVNAFALPGGPTFIHTGLMTAADNEAQVAGVLAHEISHVILRHGTNQASKANLVQIPAILAGVATGSNLWANVVNLVGTGAMLRFSRTAESEADAMGTRIMNDAGYNPIEMARFFEKLQAGGGSRAPEFLSDHPNPGNRVNAVQAEIRALPQRQYGSGVGDFERVKSQVMQIAPPPNRPNTTRGALAPPDSAKPSGNFKQLRGREFALSYPDNWEVFGDNEAATVTIAPREGIVQNSSSSSIGYGAIVSFFFPESQTRELQRATDELVQHLHGTNPTMQQTGNIRRTSVDGKPGLITTLTSASPYAGRAETDVLLTVMHPQGLFYMIFIAPESDFRNMQGVFDEMVRSLRFSN